MKNYLYPWIIAALCMLSSCDNPEEWGSENLKGSFVGAYVLGDLEAVQDPFYPNVNSSSPAIVIALNTDNISRVANHGSAGSDSLWFNTLSIKHNDIGYTRDQISFLNVFYSEDFVNIDVICDRDFDANHSKGSSVADIVSFNASSPKRWIDGGYLPDNGSGVYDEFHLPLTKVTADNLTLLQTLPFFDEGKGEKYYEFIRLEITARPADSNIGHFTVILTTDDGKVYNLPVEIDFDYKGYW